jgi:hypothetical protein
MKLHATKAKTSLDKSSLRSKNQHLNNERCRTLPDKYMYCRMRGSTAGLRDEDDPSYTAGVAKLEPYWHMMTISS